MLLISFDKDMSSEKRQQTLNSIKQWMETQQTMSAMKQHILKLVLTYAEEKLVSLWFYVDKDRVINCKSIFQQADLPDILFIQHVSNVLSSIPDPNSDLKKRVLPTVQHYKKALMAPSTEQIQNVGIAIALFGLYNRDLTFLFAAALLIMAGSYIAEERLNKKLNHVLNEQLLNGDVPRLEDGWDDLLIKASGISGRACRASAKYALKIFEKAFPNAIEEEKKPGLNAPTVTVLPLRSLEHKR